MKLSASGLFAVHVYFQSLPVPVACWDMVDMLSTSCMVLSSHIYPWITHLMSSIRVIVSLLLSYYPRTSLFQPVISIFVCSLVAILLYLCVVLGILFTKYLLSYYLCKLDNVGFGILVLQSKNYCAGILEGFAYSDCFPQSPGVRARGFLRQTSHGFSMPYPTYKTITISLSSLFLGGCCWIVL